MKSPAQPNKNLTVGAKRVIVSERKLQRHTVAAGVLWMLVYNLIWGIAWFAFMRDEWQDASAATGRRLAWTQVWGIWIILTLPIGIAIMSYSADRREQRV